MAKKSSGGSSKSSGKGEAASKKAATPSKGAPSGKPSTAAKGKSSSSTGGAGAKKQTGAGGGTQTPLIDTNLAASAAATMILNRAVTGTAQPAAPTPPAPQGEKKESAAFKNLKDSVNKPAGSGLGGILGNAAQQKKSNLPFGGGKQVGRNQTFGADVNRAGVPRRTPG